MYYNEEANGEVCEVGREMLGLPVRYAVGRAGSRGRMVTITLANRHSVPCSGMPSLQGTLEAIVLRRCGQNVHVFCYNVTVNFSLLTTRATLSVGRMCSSVALITAIPCHKRYRGFAPCGGRHCHGTLTGTSRIIVLTRDCTSSYFLQEGSCVLSYSNRLVTCFSKIPGNNACCAFGETGRQNVPIIGLFWSVGEFYM